MSIPKRQIEAELARLRTTWSELTTLAGPAPYFSWEDWKETLLNLTHDQEQEMLVRGALGAVLRQAPHRPSYLTHEDLTVVAIAAHTNSWDFPWAGDGPTGDGPIGDGEGEMG